MSTVREDAARWFVWIRDAPDDHPDRFRFEQWIAADPRHAREYAAFCDTWSDLQSGTNAPALEEAMRRRANESLSARRSAVRKGVAGLLLAALGLEGYLVVRDRTSIWRLSRDTGAGQLGEVALPDGGRLVLGGASAVAVDYTRIARRSDLMRGAASFDIRPDNERPFEVRCGPVRVRTEAARFALEGLGALLRISLLSGDATVETGPIWRRIRSTLRSGDVGELFLADEPPRFQRRPERRAADGFAFERGVLVFDQANLSEVAATLSRYRAGPVRFRPGRSSPRIVATVQQHDVEAFIDLLPALAPVSVRREGDEVWLSGR